MNAAEKDILLLLNKRPFPNQRTLAEVSGYSLGKVNQSIKGLVQAGFLNNNLQLTYQATHMLQECAPRNAIILAAGPGVRMTPINQTFPKAMIEIHGEPLVERLIKQLLAVGIQDITVVVGFMKEAFDYLIDEYGVNLVVNPDYIEKNNLHSLSLVSNRISNTYIVPCDIWCRENPFQRNELYSWYMVSDVMDPGSEVRVNRRAELVSASQKDDGNAMVGISYLLDKDGRTLQMRLKDFDNDSKNNHAFWESALFSENKSIISAKIVSARDVVEINTYEQLRRLDKNSTQLKSDILDVVANVLNIETDKISDIQVLKKGMTNRSFLFTAENIKYIMRIPGEGTDQLIDRKKEAAVYQTIAGKNLCDDPVFIDPCSGYKITKFLNNVRTADARNISDLKCCMKKLRDFHNMNLRVDHTFDIFEQILFYESLFGQKNSMYRDYAITKENVFSLNSYIKANAHEFCLTHIDAVPDNFLFYTDKDDEEELQLTDWEYAGMQDPHVDVAMFSIYSLYNKQQIDDLIDIYFENQCNRKTRAKIYCYVAACGLLWSNWCEYKHQLGVEFGEYSLRQYRYAKDFYRYALEEMK